MRYCLALFLLVTACTGCFSTKYAVAEPAEPEAVNALELALERTYIIVRVCDDGAGGNGTAVDVGSNLVVTAKHVIKDGCFYTLKNRKGDTFAAMLVSVSPDMDLALLWFSSSTSEVTMVDPELGMSVMAVGYPAGELGVTTGIVAGLPDTDHEIRFTAPIYFGNSGGGVWNNRGELVGISVSTYPSRQGWSMMVPSQYIKELLNG